MLQSLLLPIHQACRFPALLCMPISEEHWSTSAAISVGCKCSYINKETASVFGKCLGRSKWEKLLGLPCTSTFERITEKHDDKGHHRGHTPKCH